MDHTKQHSWQRDNGNLEIVSFKLQGEVSGLKIQYVINNIALLTGIQHHRIFIAFGMNERFDKICIEVPLHSGDHLSRHLKGQTVFDYPIIPY